MIRSRRRFHPFPAMIAAAITGALALTGTAFAGGVTYADGDKYVKFGGRIQMQYHQTHPSSGGGTDTLFFRRFRPFIEGSIHPDWKGKFQWDMGKAEDGNEVAVKDAYMQYTGLEGIHLTLGNAKQTFSREQLTSSKKQQLIERTFAGDHNYGSPDRSLGLHATGGAMEKKLEWAATLSQAAIDPDDDKLDFDTPVNANTDFNEGWLIGGRIDFHPLGYLKKEQGDFRGEPKATIGVAAFTWSNDSDNNTYTTAGVDIDGADGKVDVDTVTGFEVSAGFRGHGFSADAEYNSFNAESVDPFLTEGSIFVNGETTLTQYAVEAGYMVLPQKLELVAGYQSQDADGYADNWNRTSVGANWFVAEHAIKFQLTHRMGENLKGVTGADEDETFLQAQYVF